MKDQSQLPELTLCIEPCCGQNNRPHAKSKNRTLFSLILNHWGSNYADW